LSTENEGNAYKNVSFSTEEEQKNKSVALGKKKPPTFFNFPETPV